MSVTMPVGHYAGGGRAMTRALQSALDGFMGEDRAAMRRALYRYVAECQSTSLRDVYAALALELELAELREADALQMVTESLTEPEADVPPMPAPTGSRSWYFDPDDLGEGALAMPS